MMSADIFLIFNDYYEKSWTDNELPTENVPIRRPGDETQQCTVYVVRSGTAGRNPTDSSFNILIYDAFAGVKKLNQY